MASHWEEVMGVFFAPIPQKFLGIRYWKPLGVIGLDADHTRAAGSVRDRCALHSRSGLGDDAASAACYHKSERCRRSHLHCVALSTVPSSLPLSRPGQAPKLAAFGTDQLPGA